MTEQQFAQLLAILGKLIDRPYTLTGAADWPILLLLGGLVLSLIGMMWLNLREEIRDRRVEGKEEVGQLKAENERDHDLIWQAMRDCQGDCCPRKKD